MSFTSYKPFKKRNVTAKYFLIFAFWIFSVLFFTNAFSIVTNIDNATQYIKEIILTDDWTAKWVEWVIIDWYTSWGRIGSNRYCTTDFSKCINIKSIISTWDLGSLWIIKTWDLATFKLTEIDPLITNLSWRINTISWSLSTYAKISDLNWYTSISEFNALSWVVATARSDLDWLSGSFSSAVWTITDINTNFNKLIENLSWAWYTGIIEGIGKL